MRVRIFVAQKHACPMVGLSARRWMSKGFLAHVTLGVTAGAPCSKSPWQQLWEAGVGGLCVSGVGERHLIDPKCPFSLPFPSPPAIPAKKPTRECEPLSEPKVMLACLRCSLCRSLGAGAAAEHGASPPRRRVLPAWAAVPRLPWGLWT